MAVPQEKSTVVLVRFSFKATEKRKNIKCQQRIKWIKRGSFIACLFFILEFGANRFGQNLFGFREPNLI